ncbi:hypothetical protein SAMN04488060_1311 [Qipengyuania nanhaisediminis]|uniref:Uncharacterized protein n=1 Tax=Qipengyuania nanhaisediminis TaxID=604088 RepID=A0A1I5MFZ9_9SPHN|nr:hypothetical protein SAMN04488060_1311 [Qipengyuania nanhaisediminis]
MSGRRRVGGSGWAGVHGSFVGIGKKIGAKTKAGKRKIKRKHPEFSGHLTLQEARHAGLSIRQWRSQSDKTVKRVETELMIARKDVKRLEAELRLAEEARQAAYKSTDPVTKQKKT